MVASSWRLRLALRASIVVPSQYFSIAFGFTQLQTTDHGHVMEAQAAKSSLGRVGPISVFSRKAVLCFVAGSNGLHNCQAGMLFRIVWLGDFQLEGHGLAITKPILEDETMTRHHLSPAMHPLTRMNRSSREYCEFRNWFDFSKAPKTVAS